MSWLLSFWVLEPMLAMLNRSVPFLSYRAMSLLLGKWLINTYLLCFIISCFNALYELDHLNLRKTFLDSQIISTEWGAFSNGLPLTKIDREMDAASINPGEQVNFGSNILHNLVVLK